MFGSGQHNAGKGGETMQTFNEKLQHFRKLFDCAKFDYENGDVGKEWYIQALENIFREVWHTLNIQQ